MTVPQALTEAARLHGERPALAGPGVALTHAQLDASVKRAAAALEKMGIEPGAIVGVSMETSPLLLVTLLALGRVGACVVHVRPEHPQAVKDALAAQLGTTTIVGERGVQASIIADPTWLAAGTAPAHESRARADSPWRISLSSGTTGLQKAVLSTHAQALAYAAAHVRALPVGAEDRFLCHRGLDSGMVVNMALCHLLAGGRVVFPAARSLERIVEAMDRHAITQVVVSPAFLRDLLEHLPQDARHRFPALRLLRVAGSALPPALAAAGLARVSPNLVATYGATELGTVALADGELLRRAPRSVGRIAPGTEAEVVDESDAPVPRGAPGVLRFRCERMPREYVRNPEATAKAFRHGWLYPGDRGRIDDAGLLYVEGRVDDKLNLDGLKIEPGPIERALQEHPAVVEAVVFAAAPERGAAALFAAAVLRSPVEEKALREHCLRRVGAMFTPVRIFFIKDMPRNDAGKVLRAELSRRVARRAP